MSSNELNDKLRMVAEYDNVPLTRTRQDKNGNPFEGKIRLRYNTSWNWLNPVWAKVSKKVNPILTNFHADYHHAIDTNDIDFAFSVVVNAITLTTKP